MTMPPWLAFAFQELGQSEVSGERDNPRIRWYHSFTKGGEAPDEVPWCSSFLCAVFESVDIVSTRSKAAVSWATWGKPGSMSPGDVVVFGKADPDAKGTGHVALLVSTGASTVKVLGGNQRNQVSIATRPRDQIIACRAPRLSPPHSF